MKYLFSIILALLIVQTAGAQGISAGLRTGVGNTFDITSAKEGIKHNYWEKQLFLRYETRGRLAFEFSTTQYNYTYDEAPQILETFAPMDHEPLALRIQNNNIDFGLSVQYDLSCPALQDKCAIMKNFRTYLGVTAVVILAERTEIATNRYYSDGHVAESRIKQTSINDMQFGINHTTKYSFNRFFLTSTVTMTISPWEIGSFAPAAYTENSMFNLRIGAGYTL